MVASRPQCQGSSINGPASRGSPLTPLPARAAEVCQKLQKEFLTTPTTLYMGLGLATKERYTKTCALYPRSQERSLTAHLVTSRAGTLRSMPDHGSWLSTISPIPPVTFRRIVAGDFP